mmetsp:Transcript_2209/g.4937  ORF Transcript_2209/g.4937 Transcript_2209/m.4937 type:complete len:144 (-) Transcript_2209:108-539(-)
MASYRSALRFCPICNNSNWMMGKNESMELVFKCKSCGQVEVGAMEEGAKNEELCVFRHDVLFVAKENIVVRDDVIYDPTLSRIYDYNCHVCHHNEAVFYRVAETIVSDAMAIIFVCCNCSNWRTEGKDVQYSTPEERERQKNG